jgi:hypothetical protein
MYKDIDINTILPEIDGKDLTDNEKEFVKQVIEFKDECLNIVLEEIEEIKKKYTKITTEKILDLYNKYIKNNYWRDDIMTHLTTLLKDKVCISCINRPHCDAKEECVVAFTAGYNCAIEYLKESGEDQYMILPVPQNKNLKKTY